MKTKAFYAILFSFVVLPVSGQDIDLQVRSVGAIVADLESLDRDRIELVLRELGNPYDSLFTERTPYPVAVALCDLAEREITKFFNKDADVEATVYDPGLPEDTFHHDEFAPGLMDYVENLKMPEAIPALLQASMLGSSAHALADFGPEITYTILEYMEQPERNVRELGGGFAALQSVVYVWHPLDPAIRQVIKDKVVNYFGMAEEIWAGPDGNAGALNEAVTLAGFLGDDDLKQMVTDMIPGASERARRFGMTGDNTWHEYVLSRWGLTKWKQGYLGE